MKTVDSKRKEKKMAADILTQISAEE